jgi:hypothetical protein
MRRGTRRRVFRLHFGPRGPKHLPVGVIKLVRHGNGETFLWVGDAKDTCLGWLDGGPLRQLARRLDECLALDNSSGEPS